MVAACLLGLALSACAIGAAAEESGSAAGDGAAAAAKQPIIQLRPQDSWLMEICALSFIAAFLVNMYVGRRRNEALALVWTIEVGGCCWGGPQQRRQGIMCVEACVSSAGNVRGGAHAKRTFALGLEALQLCLTLVVSPPLLCCSWSRPTECWTATSLCWGRVTPRCGAGAPIQAWVWSSRHTGFPARRVVLSALTKPCVRHALLPAHNPPPSSLSTTPSLSTGGGGAPQGLGPLLQVLGQRAALLPGACTAWALR